MKAKKFLKEWVRMCESREYCLGCPVNEMCIPSGLPLSLQDEEKKFVAIVKKWSEEHPDGKEA